MHLFGLTNKEGKVNKKKMKQAFKRGYTPLEVAQIQAIARKESLILESRLSEKTFVDMLIIPCAVLAFDYWQKSADKRMPEFIKQVVSLYESMQVGAVTREEIVETFEELSRMNLETEWTKIRRENKDVSD